MLGRCTPFVRRAWLVLPILFASTVRSDEVASVVPDSALGFAVVHKVGPLNERINKFVEPFKENFGAEVPDVLTTLKTVANIRDGFDDDGDFGVAILPGSTPIGAPVVLVYVPTTDYAKFIAQFGPHDSSAKIAKITIAEEGVVVGKKGSFAVLAELKNEKALEGAIDSSESIAAGVKPLMKWVDKQDVAAVVTSAGMKIVFALAQSQLAEATRGLEQGNGDPFGNGAENPQAEAVKMMFRWADSAMKTADENLTHTALGARLDDQGSVQVSANVLFKPDGEIASAARQFKAPAAGPLAGLPAGSFAVAGGGAFTYELVEPLGAAYKQLLGAVVGELGEETVAKFSELIDEGMEMGKSIRFMSFIMGVEKGQPIFAGMKGYYEVADADEFFAAYEKMMKKYAAIIESVGDELGDDNPLKMNMKSSRIEVNGMDTLKISMDMATFRQQAEASGAPFWKAMFGESDTVDVYLTKFSSTQIALAYVDEKGTAAVIDAVKSGKGLEGDAEVAVTASQLPEGSQWAAYISPQGYLQMMITMMESSGLPIGTPPPMPKAPPIGMGVRISGDGLEAALAVPGDTIRNLLKYAVRVREMGL